MTINVRISYYVPGRFYKMNYYGTNELKKIVPLTNSLLSNLYRTIRTYRSYYRYYDPDTVDPAELSSKFVSDEFGKVIINSEKAEFQYNYNKTQKGKLCISYDFLVNAPPNTEFTPEIIEGLVFNAFTSTYAENGCVYLYDSEVYFEVLDTPQALFYQVIDENGNLIAAPEKVAVSDLIEQADISDKNAEGENTTVDQECD